MLNFGVKRLTRLKLALVTYYISARMLCILFQRGELSVILRSRPGLWTADA